MGEITDMILDGILCEICGAAMIENENDEPCGHPVTCADCAED